jgi:triosephosphate isomerase
MAGGAGQAGDLIVGNWKMNGTLAHADHFAAELLASLSVMPIAGSRLVVCPPATLLADLSVLFAGSDIEVGAQDCHAAEAGAHTGDISAAMLADCGASYVIVGHSERRTDHGETDARVAAKAKAAIEAGLIAIICVGETAAEREQGQTLDVVARQIRHSVPEGATKETCAIAYEPVWAIGSGKIPSLAEIATVHAHLAACVAAQSPAMAGAKLLYGGSVKPGNAAEIRAIDGVDGCLIGGASLNAADFLAIARA